MLQHVSLRGLILSLAMIPLFATIVFGGWVSVISYQQYLDLTRAVQLEELASAAGSMALAIPVESAASAETIDAARKTTNEAFGLLIASFDRAKTAGYDDEPLGSMFEELEQNFSRIHEFRAEFDAGRDTPALGAEIMRPIVSASVEVMRRIQLISDDKDLMQAVSGYYAFILVNEGLQTFNPLGAQLIQEGVLDTKAYSQLVRGQELTRINYPSFLELVSPAVLSQYESFWKTEAGKTFDKYRQLMIANEKYSAGADELDVWRGAVGARKKFVAGLLKQTSDEMGRMINGKLSTAQTTLVALLLTLAVLIAGLIVLSFCVAKSLAESIRIISDHMKLLASGDNRLEVPLLERTDDIGMMARSVEIFRQESVKNSRLEAEAEVSRQSAEAIRLEVQRQADLDADTRLKQATSRLATGLAALATGNLVCEIEDTLSPQFEKLRSDFNSSVKQLRDLLAVVNQTASTVNVGAAEISAASHDLSKKTEQQAVSLEETAAALEEITANVVLTTDRTINAREVAYIAHGQAQTSSVIVRDAIQAMRLIENSSEEISQITGSIDEIAFQTNLLALNAGVEAARAGDAGKGFAVVAHEVRELAQRSAKAAKEIKQLIGNSKSAVGEGVRLVLKTGDGLQSIEQLVSTISDHMNAISTASQEQSSGLTEVNTAVNYLDQVTQHNAAMVDELTAAGAGLTEESGKLTSILSRFQIGYAQKQGSASGSLRHDMSVRA
jgi:methyl-accepting chemotaxis protein